MLGLRESSRWRVVAAIVALVVVAAASVFAGARLKRDADPVAADRARPDGSLVVEPRPLTLREVEATEDGSPEEAVMRLWYWAQWGSLPNVASAYAREVVKAVGADDIVGAYGRERPTLVVTKPRIVDSETAPAGTIVTVEGQIRDAAPRPYSFTLRRQGGNWYVYHDTLLEGALQAWVQYRNTPDPSANDIPATAVRAGARAAHRYQTVGLAGRDG
jgi:hypothetical protein